MFPLAPSRLCLCQRFFYLAGESSRTCTASSASLSRSYQHPHTRDRSPLSSELVLYAVNLSGDGYTFFVSIISREVVACEPSEASTQNTNKFVDHHSVNCGQIECIREAIWKPVWFALHKHVIFESHLSEAEGRNNVEPDEDIEELILLP